MGENIRGGDELMSARRPGQDEAPIADAMRRYWDTGCSASVVTPYPPGIPAVAPGEVYTEELVGYLEEFVSCGGFVEGASDPTLERLRVVTGASV